MEILIPLLAALGSLIPVLVKMWNNKVDMEAVHAQQQTTARKKLEDLDMARLDEELAKRTLANSGLPGGMQSPTTKPGSVLPPKPVSPGT